MANINLADLHLFGNEVAEDEKAEVFISYAYERREIESFCDQNIPIQIVRGYKGEGKSALIRLAKVKISESQQEQIIIDTTGPAISPNSDSDNFDCWVKEWKKNIFNAIASEIGSTIGFAWNDDSISLVEIAEKNGFRSKNFVSMIVDRLKSNAIPIEYIKKELISSEKLVQRWSKKCPNIWFFVDDIDRNFDGGRRDSIKIAAFFDAVRAISKEIDTICFRCSIRPNTFIQLKRRFEGLSHVGQYITDLSWNEQDFLLLLGRRIEGYLRRTNQEKELLVFSKTENDRARELIKLVFESPIKWGGDEKYRPIHVPLFTLSMHRPRWLIELCRVSAVNASRKEHKTILSSDLFDELGEFGERRLHDTVAEFSPQCPQINEILDAFRSQEEQYTTSQPYCPN